MSEWQTQELDTYFYQIKYINIKIYMSRPNHRRRREEEDQESIRQKQLEEQVLEKKLLLRQQFQYEQQSSRHSEIAEAKNRERQFKRVFDQVHNYKLKLQHSLKIENRRYEILEDSSDGIDTFLHDELKAIQLEHLEVENQMFMQNQLTISLYDMQSELAAQRLRTAKKVQQLKRIQQVITTNFTDHIKVQERYLSEEKQITHTLEQTKKQLNNLNIIEQAYTSKVVDNWKGRKKIIEREENILGHLQVRMEEARQQNDILLKKVEDLHQEELSKRDRHKKFYYIGQYVTLFEELERFVQEGQPDEKLFQFFNKAYANSQQTDSNKQPMKLSIGPHFIPRSHRKISHIRTHSPNNRHKSWKPQYLTLRDRRLAEIFFGQGEDFDRLEIVSHVEQYYEQHPQGPSQLINQALIIYQALQVKQNSLQSAYQQIIHEEQEKKKLIEQLTVQCEKLMQQQLQVESVENDQQYNLNFDNQMVSIDSGMIKMTKSKVLRDEGDHFDHAVTTINKVTFQGTECQQINNRLSHEFKLNEFFILKLYTNVNESLSRLCYALVWLAEYTQMVPSDLDQRCTSILKHIANREVKIWIPTYNNQGPHHHDPNKNIFQLIQANKQEKRGSFVNIFNRKRNTVNKSQLITQTTPMPLTLSSANSQVQQTPNNIRNNAKTKTFLQFINQSKEQASFIEDGSETITTTNNNNENKEDHFRRMVDHSKLSHFPKAYDEWVDLVRNDKLSSYFIKQDQLLEIIDTINKVLLNGNYKDDVSLIINLYDQFLEFVYKGNLQLKELLYFIFQNFKEVVGELNCINRSIRDDLKEMDGQPTLQAKVQTNPFLKDMQIKVQDKYNRYINNDDMPAQGINLDGNKHQNDDQKYYMKFLTEANKIQRKNSLLRPKLVQRALKDIEEQKRYEMDDNEYYAYSDANHLSDNDYIDSERKHLKFVLNKQLSDIQRLGSSPNKKSNYELSVACIDRFFHDINDFESQETKKLNKSATFLSKLSNLHPLSRSSEHFKLKSKLLEDQKIITKKFHQEAQQLSPSYDKPNHLYQLRKNANLNTEMARKSKQLLNSVKLKKIQTLNFPDDSPRYSSRLPKFESVPQIQNYGSSPLRQDRRSSKFKPAVTNKIKIVNQSQTQRSPLPELENTTLLTQDGSYFDIQHEIMSQHLEKTLKQKTYLVDKNAANVAITWNL